MKVKLTKQEKEFGFKLNKKEIARVYSIYDDYCYGDDSGMDFEEFISNRDINNDEYLALLRLDNHQPIE